MPVFFYPLLLDMYFCTQDIFCNLHGLPLKAKNVKNIVKKYSFGNRKENKETYVAFTMTKDKAHHFCPKSLIKYS